MSIFGIAHRDGSPVAASALETMQRAMADWGPHASTIWREGPCGLGQARLYSTPQAHRERLPRVENDGGLAFTAGGRVDNRDELCRDLGLSHAEHEGLPDGELLLHAYRRWGSDCPARVHGDWSFAAWHPAERRLFLARDHLGNTALYYYGDARIFAFASSRRALLDLRLAPVEMDELYLAQVLVSWTAYHGERTIHKPIHRLPPAHCLEVTPDRVRTRCYWKLEETPEIRLRKREDYADGLRALFDEAVRARLRAAGQVSVTLSGGLDSSAVTATAARFLAQTGQRLAAFTSVPLADTTPYVGARFGDEWPFAQATARFAGNVDLHPIAATALSPIAAIRRMLAIVGEPGHAAGNFYWLLELEEAARAQGRRVLLTGQMGNAGVSWTGEIGSQSPAYQIRRLGWRAWAKRELRRAAPPGLLAWRRRRKTNVQDLHERWTRASAIHPDFARRLRLYERRLADPREAPPRTPREHRCAILLPGRSFVGALHAEMGAAHGLEVRDPTADARVLAFALSVPDRVFMDPATGLDRLLIREAMRGRLPDEVRLNRRRGRQAGDLVPRLRACAAEVETALDELARGPAAAYVAVPHLREVWQMIRTEDTPEAFRTAITVLTRGIMAGLWVNEFYA